MDNKPPIIAQASREVVKDTLVQTGNDNNRLPPIIGNKFAEQTNATAISSIQTVLPEGFKKIAIGLVAIACLLALIYISFGIIKLILWYAWVSFIYLIIVGLWCAGFAAIGVVSIAIYNLVKKTEAGSFGDKKQTKIVAGVGLLAFPICFWIASLLPKMLVKDYDDKKNFIAPQSFTKKDITLATAKVILNFNGLPAHGSAVITGVVDGKMYLYTNRHCLGYDELQEIIETYKIKGATIHEYGIKVQFSSGKIVLVDRIALHKNKIDVARIELDASKLVYGVDYRLASFEQAREFEVGDNVVAVGSPTDGADGAFDFTHTFGRISALRDKALDIDRKCKLVQHDAAINPGNSGGPLFLNDSDKYYWIGLNTWTIKRTQGIYFAICASEAIDAEYLWANADSHGFVDLMREIYGLRIIAAYQPK